MIEGNNSSHRLIVIALLTFVFLTSFVILTQLESIGKTVEWNFIEAPYFIWTYRLIDVIVQAFIIFATVAAISTLFREEKIGFVEDQEGG